MGGRYQDLAKNGINVRSQVFDGNLVEFTIALREVRVRVKLVSDGWLLMRGRE